MRCPTVCLETFVLLLQLHFMLVCLFHLYFTSWIFMVWPLSLVFLSLESMARYQWSAKGKPGLLVSVSGVRMLCLSLDFLCPRMLVSDYKCGHRSVLQSAVGRLFLFWNFCIVYQLGNSRGLNCSQIQDCFEHFSDQKVSEFRYFNYRCWVSYKICVLIASTLLRNLSSEDVLCLGTLAHAL